MSDRSFVSGSSSQSIRNKEGEGTEIRFLRVDHDYIGTLSLELLEGRNFLEGEKVDSIPNVLANETLVSALGLEDPIGERVVLGSSEMTVNIIGIVRDFHYDSMRDEIKPLLLHNFPYNSIWYLFVKADGDMAAVRRPGWRWSLNLTGSTLLWMKTWRCNIRTKTAGVG